MKKVIFLFFLIIAVTANGYSQTKQEVHQRIDAYHED